MAVLHDSMAARWHQRPTGSEYSWEVDYRRSCSRFTCRQVREYDFFVSQSSHHCVASVTSLHAGQVRHRLASFHMGCTDRMQKTTYSDPPCIAP